MFEFKLVRIIDSRKRRRYASRFLVPRNRHLKGAFTKRFDSIEEAALFMSNSYRVLGILDCNLDRDQFIAFNKKVLSLVRKKERST